MLGAKRAVRPFRKPRLAALEQGQAGPRRRFGLRSGDVLINRSGEALGKVAYFASDEPAVFSDFTMLRMYSKDRPKVPETAYLRASALDSPT